MSRPGFFFLFFILCFALTLVGCATAFKELKSVAQWQVSDFPEQVLDDFDLDGLKPLLQNNLKVWESRAQSGDAITFAGLRVTASSQVDLHRKLLSALNAKGPDRRIQFLQILRNETQLVGLRSEEKWPIKMTSYYEPVIPSSSVRTPEYFQPLYAQPPGLINLSLKEFVKTFPQWEVWSETAMSASRKTRMRARRNKEDVFVPFYTRQQIDEGGELIGRSEVLAYVRPIDAFFLQIQGSGVLENVRTKKSQTLGYANQNGHPYYAIGRALKAVIPISEMSMTRIREALLRMEPKEREELFALNSSYVFFQKLSDRGLTSLGTPVVDGRTVATDWRQYPKGFLGLLSFLNPEKDQIRQRWVLNQDTGGAIRGARRLDLFWGRGPEAGKRAGRVNWPADLQLLIPKTD